MTDQAHDSECRLARQVLITGEPAVKRRWALGLIGSCGAQAVDAISSLMREHRSASARTEELDALAYQASTVIAPGIAATALDIAADPSAGKVARIQALRILWFQLNPRNFLSYEEFLEPGAGISIVYADYPLTIVAPLEAETRREIRPKLSRVVDDPSIPEDLRAAARNVLVSLRAESRSDARDSVPAKLREDCRLAEQILTEVQAAEKRDWALGVISACPNLADVLPHLWRDPPTEESELEKLFELSRRVQDYEVFTTVLDLASSSSRPSLPRIAALGVLASYLKASLVLDFDGLRPLETYGPIEWNNVWGRGTHPPPKEVDDPLPDDFEETTRQLIQRLSESEEDSKVRAAAWWLASFRGLGIPAR